MSILSDTPPAENPDREASPVIPDKPAAPPAALPLQALPASAQRALLPTPTPSTERVLMPVSPQAENIPVEQAAEKQTKEKGKAKKKDGSGAKQGDSAEYAYEYVSVVQCREGRKNIQYELTMRQDPLQARMCGVGEKSDRRPVDPTPIVQLKVIDGNGTDVTRDDVQDGKKKSLRRPEAGPNGMTFMQNPYYFLFACLVGGDEQDQELHVIDDGKTRFLTGCPVSSLYHLKDLDNTDAAFFVFPDLGVRKEGRYKLKLTLFEIVDQEVFYCTTMYTKTFSVFSAKKFPGMDSATALSKSFAEQGLKIRVRKDPRKRAAVIPKRKSTNESEQDMVDSIAKRPRGRSSLPPSQRQSHAPAGYDNHYAPPQNGYHQYHPGSSGHRMPPPPVPQDGYPRYTPGSTGRPMSHGSSRLHTSLPPPSQPHHPYEPGQYNASPAYHREHHRREHQYPHASVHAHGHGHGHAYASPDMPHSPAPDPRRAHAYYQQHHDTRPHSASAQQASHHLSYPPRHQYAYHEEPPLMPPPMSSRHEARPASRDYASPARMPAMSPGPPSSHKRQHSNGISLPPMATRPEAMSAPDSGRSSVFRDGPGAGAASANGSQGHGSPATTPGGTKPTNRMGLANLVD